MTKFNVIRKVDGEASWVSYAKNRINSNLNYLTLFTGATGSGKTYNAISYAIKIAPDFDITRQLVFKFKDLMALVNDDVWFQNLKYKIIIWDEPQIEMSNRRWQSKLNQSILELFSTFRAQNIIVFMCAPYKDFLDASVMKLIHAEMRCKGWSKKTGIAVIRPVLFKYDSDRHRFWYYSLYVHVIGKGYIKLSRWEIKKAPPDILKQYEVVKKKFNEQTNRRIENSLVVQSQVDDEDELRLFAKSINYNPSEIKKKRPNWAYSTILRRISEWKRVNDESDGSTSSPLTKV